MHRQGRAGHGAGIPQERANLGTPRSAFGCDKFDRAFVNLLWKSRPHRFGCLHAEPKQFSKEMFGRDQSLSSVISKVRAIVEGFGALRSGEFVQDLVGPGGVLFGKVSDIFAVGGGAGSPVAGGAA